MQKMIKLEEIYDSLPKLDCGSCGSPSCHSLAEDIVRGYAKETDCIFKLREKLSFLVNEMVQLDNPKQENDKSNNKENGSNQ